MLDLNYKISFCHADTKTAKTQGTPTGLYKNGQTWPILMLHCLDI